jgi:hypothetical protein
VGPVEPGEVVVHCLGHDGTGIVVARLALRTPSEPASAVLDTVLRRALAERRRGRVLTVLEPPEVAALLVALGLGGAARSSVTR